MVPPKYGEDQSVKKSCTVSLAAGVVHINKDYKGERNASSILHDAEIALAEARKSTTQKIVLYDESLLNTDVEQKEAEYLIKDAMTHNGFFLLSIKTVGPSVRYGEILSTYLHSPFV